MIGSYVYDAAGKKGLLSSVTDESARTVTYGYTSRNQLYSVADSAGTAYYVYDANGAETKVTLPNTVYSDKVYDDAGRLTSVTNKNSGGTTLSSFSYAYSDDDLRTSCTELSGDVVSYGYDAAHRLTSESRTGSNSYSRSYTLDGVGNRTAQTVGGVTTNFTLNNDDELTATSGGFVNSYSYNLNGEQTSRTLSGTAYTLAYDYEGQLTSITQGGNTTSFAYDALGRRHTRTAGSTTTRFIPGPGGILLEKQGSNYTAVYTHGNAQVRKDSEYPLYDGIGSERTVTASNQTVSGTITFEGFGQTIATTGSSANPYMFKGAWGYRNDADAGLTHVGARYYDAQVGRFITRDSYLDQHPYLYCGHEPVTKTDPSGHFPGSLLELFRPPENQHILPVPGSPPDPSDRPDLNEVRHAAVVGVVAIIGAGFGALVGSGVPVIGTGAGGTVGGAIGGVFGEFIWQLMKGRYWSPDPIPFGT